MEQESSTSLEHVVSDWHENHSLYLCCSAVNLEGHPAFFLRGTFAVLQRTLHLYSRLLLSLALSAVGAAGAQWCVLPWRVSGYFNYSCRTQNKYSHHGSRKGMRRKEQFIGANIGCQAKQLNKLQKTIFLLWKSSTLGQLSWEGNIDVLQTWDCMIKRLLHKHLSVRRNGGFSYCFDYVFARSS